MTREGAILPAILIPFNSLITILKFNDDVYVDLMLLDLLGVVMSDLSLVIFACYDETSYH